MTYILRCYEHGQNVSGIVITSTLKCSIMIKEQFGKMRKHCTVAQFANSRNCSFSKPTLKHYRVARK